VANEVGVVVEAVHDEAKKWKNLSDKMAPVKTATENLTLNPMAFFIGDLGAVPHSLRYNSYQQFMATIIGGAATEFEQFGEALDRIADEYDRTDKVGSIDLKAIYGNATP
jgi:hypothetical protein